MTETTLSPADVRTLLRECVTVVKPGETLVIRLPVGTSREQVAEYMAVLDVMRDAFGLTAVILIADELGIVQAGTDEAFAGRVMDAINALDVHTAPRGIGDGTPVLAEPCPWVGEERLHAPAFIAKGCGDECGDDPRPIEAGPVL